jgi:asparagine N-glycosylation enzyme membrane subunit Stt3
VGVAAALAALAALFFPLRLAAPRWPAQQRMEAAMHLEEGVVGALRFLRDRGAPLAQPLGELSPRGRFRHPPGNYGVMSFWDLGHYVAAIADRPAVAIGALAVDTAQWFLIEDEEESLRALAKGLEPGEERRYIVVDARTAADVFGTIVRMTGGNERDYAEPFAKGEAADGKKVPLYTYGPRFRRSMLYRLFHDPSDLSRYRLVYASPQKHALAYVATPVPTGMSVTRRAFSLDDPRAARNWQAMKTRGGIVRQGSAFMYDIVITSTARVYERVAGARIAGTAAPGARVEARLTLRARATALEVPYRRQGVAGPDGAFELVVPYPAGGTPPGDSDVGAREAYEIFVDGQPAGRAVVSLDDVRGGRVVKLRPR